MTMRTSNKLRTICEVLREINDLHQGDTAVDAETRGKLVEAEDMAKRMDTKLLKYAKRYHKTFFAEKPDYEPALKKRMEKSYLTGGADGNSH